MNARNEQRSPRAAFHQCADYCMFPTSWSNSPLRLPALRPLTVDPEYAGSYRAKDEASLGAAILGGGFGHGTRRSPSTGAVTDNPSLLRSSMDQQLQCSSAFSATLSAPGGSYYDAACPSCVVYGVHVLALQCATASGSNRAMTGTARRPTVLDDRSAVEGLNLQQTTTV